MASQEQRAQPSPGISRRAALILFGLTTGLWIALSMAKIFGLAAGPILRRAWYRATAPRSLDLYLDDPELGWIHEPEARRRHKTREFDVLYSIRADGGRNMSTATAGGAPPPTRVAVYGGSFSFGHGVEDDEAWPAVLQDGLWAGRAVIRNRAVSGYGTGQAMLALRRDLAEAPIDLAIYGWIYAHETRNGGRLRWLEAVAPRRAPSFRIDGRGRPRVEGLIGPEAGLPDDAPGIEAQEAALTDALLAEMASLTRASGTRLIVVLLPFPTRNPRREPVEARLRTTLAVKGIDFVDLADLPHYLGEGLYYEADVHPGPRWHRRVAADLGVEAARGGWLLKEAP